MKYTHSTTALLLSSLLLASQISASEHSSWSYEDATGPANWGHLSDDYKTCATGEAQSPINITDAVDQQEATLDFNYQPGGYEVINNGHAIQVNYQPGSSVAIDGHSYELKQFHFHTPSENTVEGESFPLEAHLVHQDSEGHLAVVSVLYRDGAANQELAAVWQKLPGAAGAKNELATKFDAATLLPEALESYQFTGSLTTPPCSEGVSWVVLKHAKTVDSAQIEQFSSSVHTPNNRPVQPINTRVIVE